MKAEVPLIGKGLLLRSYTVIGYLRYRLGNMLIAALMIGLLVGINILFMSGVIDHKCFMFYVIKCTDGSVSGMGDSLALLDRVERWKVICDITGTSHLINYTEACVADAWLVEMRVFSVNKRLRYLFMFGPRFGLEEQFGFSSPIVFLNRLVYLGLGSFHCRWMLFERLFIGQRLFLKPFLVELKDALEDLNQVTLILVWRFRKREKAT